MEKDELLGIFEKKGLIGVYEAGMRELAEGVVKASHQMNTNMYGVSISKGEWQAFLESKGVEVIKTGISPYELPSAAYDKYFTPPDSHPVTRLERPKIVCLCGSGRFKDVFEQAEFTETLAGKIVLTIECNTKDVARTEGLSSYKPMLDELHLRKIDLADEVLILNVGKYIGDSTKREIDYAQKLGKVIRYLEPI